MSKQTERDAFRSRWGFILACIGSAVGMGNIWRFPYLVSAWGGMTFLLPYFLFVLLIGSTGIIGEMALGRSTRSGPIGAFGQAAALRGRRSAGEAVGYIPVLGSLALAIGYSCVVGWIFRYFALALDGGLFAMGQNMNVIVDRFNGTACGWGNNFWLVIALAVNFAIMAFGVGGGIERANKVMMPVLFFLFALDPAGLSDPKLWIYAFGQAFFSLSVAGNGTVIYGSYFSDDESIPSAARNVALFDTLAALLAALVIIPAMAAGGADLSDGGPGLMFIFLVNVFNGMPGGRVIGLVFFLCVLFAGLTSLVNLYEVSVEALQDKLRLKRVAAVAVIAVIGTAVSLCIQAIVSDWMDVVSIYICPLGALLAGILFFWVAGKDFVLAAVNKGAGKPIGAWFYPLSKYVYCVCALLALIAGALLGGIG